MNATRFFMTAPASLLAVLLFASAARATVLTFDIDDGDANTNSFQSTHAAYGDRVNTTSTTVGSFTYNYGQGDGFTPNVVTDYALSTNAVDQYAYRNTDAWTWDGVDQLKSTESTGKKPATFLITFTPDAGIGVRVNSFDLRWGGYRFAGDFDMNATWTLYEGSTSGDAIATGNATVTSTAYPGSIPNLPPAGGSSTISTGITTFYSGPVVLQITQTQGDGTRFGIENISFSQTPEPASGATLALLGLGGLAMLPRRRRRNV